MNVELYTRSGHPQCDEARRLLADLRDTFEFDLREVDVAGDPSLSARYGSEVPVVFIDGRHELERRFGRQDLVDRLERARALRMGTSDHESVLTGAVPVSRVTKVLFAAFALLSVSGVLGSKAWQVWVEPGRLERETIGALRMDEPAPRFELEDRKGNAVRLQEFAGKTVLLNFWATWCPPCVEEMPSLVGLASRLSSERFVVLAASVDDSWGEIDAFLRTPAPGLLVLHDPGSTWARTYGTTKLPETYVIGPDGRLVAKFVGPRDWGDPAFGTFLRKLEKDPSAPAPGP